MVRIDKKRLNRGFTMVETLFVVTITVILMGVAFVGVINYRRSMLKLELNETAKEIYIAAQNHLLTAKDEGLIEQYSDSDGELGETNGSGSYFFVYSKNGNDPLNSPVGDGEASLLGQMLPFGSIDETVRLGGNYIIEYQFDTGLIKKVLYTKPDGIGGFFGSFGAQTLDKNNARTLLSQSEYDFNIGVYEGSSLPTGTIKRPKLQVTNGDKLIATVTDTNSGEDYKLVFLIRGMSSGKQEYYWLKDDGSTILEDSNYLPLRNVTTDASNQIFEITLDDVITSDSGGSMHFADLFPGFFPGEPIELSAFAARTDEKIAKVAWSAEVKTNSLFESVKENRACISSFRHFENLDEEISGVNISPVQDAGDSADDEATDATSNAIELTGADQLTDLDWNAFIENNGSGEPSKKELSVCTKDINSPTPSETNALFPVDLDYDENAGRFEYNGHKHRVVNAKVLYSMVPHTENPAGLFGVLDSVSINDLDLVNCNIQTLNGNAGALAGSMTNCKISGVLAYNEKQGDSGDAGMSISGSQSTGGLVGKADNCEFEYCGAAVYVKASGESAGGLIGESTGTKISYSYSGGHTVEGKYLVDTDGMKDGEAGRYNVQAQSGDAGGLVGKATSGLTVDSCYSTCSVLGNTAGGLIGSMGSNSVSNSYATGIVSGSGEETKAGAFIGSLTGNSVGNGNKYLSIANGEMLAVGGKPEITTIEDGSENITAYTVFAPYNPDSVARPYDQKLGSRFLYRTVDQLASEGKNIPDRLKVHHGDWQDYATLVVNTPTGGTSTE